MADMVVAYLGWNSSSQSWGQSTWGNNVALSGASGAVGSVVVTAAANCPVTGLAATGSVGSISIVVDAAVDVTGIAATGSPGAATVTGTAVVNVTGVAGTGSVGAIDTNVDVDATVTGLQATGTVSPAGVLVWGSIVPDQNPGYSTCLLYTSPSPRDGLLSRMPSSA